jgi:hypothetical protein
LGAFFPAFLNSPTTVSSNEGADWVQKLIEGDDWKKTKVKLGRRDNELVEVLEGVDVGISTRAALSRWLIALLLAFGQNVLKSANLMDTFCPIFLPLAQGISRS